jgi:hypothetical protein
VQPRCLQEILCAAAFQEVLVFAENWQEIVAAALFESVLEDPSIAAVCQSVMPGNLSETLNYSGGNCREMSAFKFLTSS